MKIRANTSTTLPRLILWKLAGRFYTKWKEKVTGTPTNTNGGPRSWVFAQETLRSGPN